MDEAERARLEAAATEAEQRERERERLEAEERERRARLEAAAREATEGNVAAAIARSVAETVDAVRARVAPEALEDMDRAFNREFNPAIRATMEMEYWTASAVNAEVQRALLVESVTAEVMSRPAVVDAVAAADRETDATERERAQERAALLGASLGAIEGRRRQEAAQRRRRPTMFRRLYRDWLCRDCREVSHRQVCECGYMRPLSDEFFVVPRFASIAWLRSGPWPRLVGFTDFELYRIGEAANAVDAAGQFDDEGWGGGAGSGAGFGNGDGLGGGWDPDGANEAFTANAMRDAAAYAAFSPDAAAADVAPWPAAAFAAAAPWFEGAYAADAAGFDDADAAGADAAAFDDADYAAADAGGTLADFVVETFERW
jgi:hypothetical protein